MMLLFKLYKNYFVLKILKYFVEMVRVPMCVARGVRHVRVSVRDGY
jgi:hypothetical protein